MRPRSNETFTIVKSPTNRLWKQHNRSQHRTEAVKIKLTCVPSPPTLTHVRAPRRVTSHVRGREIPRTRYHLNICCLAYDEIQWNNRLNWQFLPHLSTLHSRNSTRNLWTPFKVRRSQRLQMTQGAKLDSRKRTSGGRTRTLSQLIFPLPSPPPSLEMQRSSNDEEENQASRKIRKCFDLFQFSQADWLHICRAQT